jgi:hypothetical protein
MLPGGFVHAGACSEQPSSSSRAALEVHMKTFWTKDHTAPVGGATSADRAVPRESSSPHVSAAALELNAMLKRAEYLSGW